MNIEENNARLIKGSLMAEVRIQAQNNHPFTLHPERLEAIRQYQQYHGRPTLEQMNKITNKALLNCKTITP